MAIKQCFPYVFIIIFTLALMLSGWSGATAQTKLFLTPGKKQQAHEDSPGSSYLFLKKKKSAKKKHSVYTKYSPQQTEQQKMIVTNIKQIPLETDFNFSKLYAEYKGAEKMDKALFEPGGPAPMSSDELKKIAAVKKMPTVLSMLEKKEKNAEYVAALMKPDLKGKPYEPAKADIKKNVYVKKSNQPEKNPYGTYIFNHPDAPKKPKKVFSKY